MTTIFARCPALVERTKHLMRIELAYMAAPAPARLAGWPAAIFGLAVFLALGMFYALTVGTVLRMFAPPEWAHILTRSLFLFPAVGVFLLSGAIMVGVLTRFRFSRTQEFTAG
jgi:hypothetical protein